MLKLAAVLLNSQEAGTTKFPRGRTRRRRREERNPFLKQRASSAWETGTSLSDRTGRSSALGDTAVCQEFASEQSLAGRCFCRASGQLAAEVTRAQGPCPAEDAHCLAL